MKKERHVACVDPLAARGTGAGACPMTSAKHEGQHEGSTDRSPAEIGEHLHAEPLPPDKLGPLGQYTPSVLTGVRLEDAAEGSAARGVSLAYYARERSSWVIRRITIRHDRPLRYGVFFFKQKTAYEILA